MIHHVAYFQLKPEVNATMIEELVRTSRSMLLRIPEILSVRSGRNLNPDSQWQFFVGIEVNSLDKLSVALDDSFYLKFIEKHIKPNTLAHFAMDFELDPSKELKYS
ncbi:MAG: Dabb family protein [Gloeobacteraceae cyanobacterium ES-bin-144]|nr:Dabb family protein [Verrucomicrobiales bacterium]